MKRWAKLSLLLASSWLVSTCSVLVDPDSLAIKCEVNSARESEDPCLIAGMHCINSECKPCKGSSEICNGVDDDCNGIIDDGHDEDEDGFTWCGGGHAEFADCAPNDPRIHPPWPGGPAALFIPAPEEACDGKDNDCDSKVDEAPECEPMHSCVRDGCSGRQVCDATTGVCVEPRPVGSGCTMDSDCAGGFCVKKGAYPLGVELTDNRCATACCTDSDCATGLVCVASDSGVRICLPKSIAGRGDKPEGERCLRDSECASGSCSMGRCISRCSVDGACKNAECVLSPGGVNEAPAWSCGEVRGRDAAGGGCSGFDPGACRSGLCSERGVCAKACGRNADCAPDGACGFKIMRALLLGPAAIVTYCTPRGESENETQSQSAVLCCTSADCSGAQQCVPYALEGGLWIMACRNNRT